MVVPAAATTAAECLCLGRPAPAVGVNLLLCVTYWWIKKRRQQSTSSTEPRVLSALLCVVTLKPSVPGSLNYDTKQLWYLSGCGWGAEPERSGATDAQRASYCCLL